MTGLRGNRGEWSELYTFLKLLGTGRIYGADGKIVRRDDVYYDINRIIRDEGNGELHYIVSDDGQHAEVRSGEKTLLTVSRSRLLEEADYLLDSIRESSGRSFSVERSEIFMEELQCHKLKAPSSNKSDITIQIHDHRTGMDPTLEFSIKSMLGQSSTLVNSSQATNFVFNLVGDVEPFAERFAETDMKLADQYSEMIHSGIKFEFSHTSNPVLEDNLCLIDSLLPRIVAEMLLMHYVEGVSKVSEQVRLLKERNPLGFKDSSVMSYYSYKVKKLLCSYALGMQSSKVWQGNEDASGGYIIVKEDGEVLCYHLYNRNDFEDYLLENTKLDTPSTKRNRFSHIECEGGRYFLKLNLQIRFI